MSDTSALLGLPYIQAAQAQKHVTHNEALRVLDVIVQAAVTDRTRTAPPPTPAEGDRHIVGAGATGAWAAQDHAIALFQTGVWAFYAPLPGWQVHVLNEGVTVVFDGTDWTAGGTPSTLGVNTSADTTNRLAVAGDATLLTHTGGSHQVKVNKNAATDTASLLFQTNWSGRAEMGTTGSDGFSIKVSADGGTWHNALTFDPNTGLCDGQAVQQSPTDTTPGRLARADHTYGPGNLLGSVSHTAGTPTGAVIERGTTPDGDYVRFADGTQICTRKASVDVTLTTAQSFAFAAAFSTDPAVSLGHADSAPNAALALGNIAVIHGAAGAAQAWTITLTSGGTAGTPDADALMLTAMGRWF